MKRLLCPLIAIIFGVCGGCAFVPRVVDVDKVEGRISYPRDEFKGRHKIAFGDFTDRRASKTDFGVGRNKFMMVTANVSMKGDLLSVMEKMVRANFLASSIEEGTSPLVVNANLLEAYTDLSDPNHVFVRIRMSLNIVERSSNTALFNQVLTGYSETGVVQLGNEAHENAFVAAMNQISDKVHLVAYNTARYFEESGPSQARKDGDSGKTNDSSGTGFFISKDGHLVTNHHVIENCRKIDLVVGGAVHNATVLRSDPTNDLALLKASFEPSRFARIRAGKGIRVGEGIVAVGFPLGEMLGSGVKATTGNVSALTGLSNDITKMQITAPIQPGNSGGPLMDLSGNVVGVVSSKLDEVAAVRVVGSISQNVNFAIKSSTLELFLETNNFDYQTSVSSGRRETADIVEAAREYTVQVRCSG